jgi:hypothetical protein
MTLKQLENYRTNKAELELIKEELDGYRVEDSVQASSDAPSYSKHTVKVEGLPPLPEVQKLLRQYAKLESFVKEVEEFIDSIDDPEIRKIVYYRYYFTPEYRKGRRRYKGRISWQRLANSLGYCSEHTPKRKLYGFLDNLHKE